MLQNRLDGRIGGGHFELAGARLVAL